MPNIIHSRVKEYIHSVQPTGTSLTLRKAGIGTRSAENATWYKRFRCEKCLWCWEDLKNGGKNLCYCGSGPRYQKEATGQACEKYETRVDGKRLTKEGE